ncbi:MAG: DNA gyrase inhibitor YacG [Burkholderiaceae bacterium]
MHRAAPTVECPTCRRRHAYVVTNPWRPFCSERCRQHDLGAWAAEQFRIAAADAPSGDAAAADIRAVDPDMR